MFEERVWIPSKEHEWELATILRATDDAGEELLVESASTRVQSTVKKANTHLVDASHLQSLDDLCMMNNLHEAPLLDMLRRRLLLDIIYTNTGDVLISVNPYKAIPGLYDDPRQYLHLPDDGDDDADEAKQTTEERDGSSCPHVYKIANRALRALVYERHGASSAMRPVNQSVIISGESGAGKTEASKYVMAFLIEANSYMCSLVTGGTASQQRDLGERIKRVLVESSLVFEAFGNAKTVRNDNSSRFGKYIKLQYTSDNQLVSAFTETFLLEKSRLGSLGKDERNYHIFYQLVRGMAAVDAGLQGRLRISAVESFKMLTAGDCTVVGSADNDTREFVALCQALTTLGCSAEELTALWSLLACVLHLGNAVCAEPANEGQPAEISIPTLPIEEVAAILGVEASVLCSCLTTQKMKAAMRGSVHTKILSASDAANNVAAFQKYVYQGLFTWLVRKVNKAHSAVAHTKAQEKFIGILDIFGFEILGLNSFEQLCINFTNERLQQQFNERVFVLEQEEYTREGISWASIAYKDNQHVIDLIAKKPVGLFMILEEHSMMNRKPDDVALVNAFNSSHDKTSAAYSKSRFGNDGFLVRHFAGDVSYAIDGFLVKNNNSLQDDLLELIVISSNSFLRSASGTGEVAPGELGYMEPTAVEESSAGPKDASADRKKMASAVTVSFQFRNQLDLLMATLRATEPHYIKCIKSNAAKAANTFSGPLVMEQLRYSGALEVVRIRREGYPSRMGYRDFYACYEILAYGRGWTSSTDCSEEQARAYTVQLAGENLEAGIVQPGATRLFLRDGALLAMHDAVHRFLSRYATKIQNGFRRFSCVKKFRVKRKQIIALQALARMRSNKKVFKVSLDKDRVARRARAEAEAARLAAEAEARRIAADNEEARRKEMMRKRVYKFCRNAVLGRRIYVMHAASGRGDVDLIRKIATSRPGDVLVRDRSKALQTVHHAAVRGGHVEVLKVLGLKPRDAAARDKNGHTLLHAAAAEPRMDVIMWLTDAIDKLSETSGPAAGASKATGGVDAAQGAADAISRLKLGGDVIKSGWLMKRKVGKPWGRRWCVMTRTTLTYFKAEDDVVPKGTITLSNSAIKRVTDPSSDPAFEIVSVEIKKKTLFGSLLPTAPNSMFFSAPTELELIEWITHLKAGIGNIQPIRTSAIRRVDVLHRQRVMPGTSASKQGETALHSLVKAQSPAVETDEDKLIELMSCCTWLELQGCSREVADAAGRTAAQLAAEKSLTQLAAFLSRPSPFALPPTVPGTPRALFPEPSKYTGYNYLSIRFSKHVAKGGDSSFTGYKCPILTISVFNSKRMLVEAEQDIVSPAFLSERKIYWGAVWHMQTPLENLEEGSVVCIGLNNQPTAAVNVDVAAVPIAAGDYAIVPKTIDSGPGLQPLMFAGFVASDGSVRAHSMLEIEILLSAKP